jgi:hypothetical protein
MTTVDLRYGRFPGIGLKAKLAQQRYLLHAPETTLSGTPAAKLFNCSRAPSIADEALQCRQARSWQNQ